MYLVLVLYRNVDTDEQSKDASFVENSNKIPMNMATLDFLWSENASRNDAWFQNVQELSRGSFKVNDDRPQAKQSAKAAAKGAPIVCESWKTDGTINARKTMQQRIDDE